MYLAVLSFQNKNCKLLLIKSKKLIVLTFFLDYSIFFILATSTHHGIRSSKPNSIFGFCWRYDHLDHGKALYK